MKPTRSKALQLVLGVLLAGIYSSPALSITDEEIFRNFRFNFANPGARALAMGGAFIAIANDATAAQANPARLAVLRRPEVFAEIRSRTTDSSSADTGRFFIDPGTNPAASLVLNSATEPKTQTIPSVISFVWPFKFRRALTLGISRQEILAVNSSATNSFTFTPVDSSLFQDPNNPTEFIRTDARGAIDSTLILYNLSAGYQLTKDLFVGGSAVFGQLDMTANQVSEISDPSQLSFIAGIDPRFQSPVPAPFISTSINDRATDIKWSFGLFWKLNDVLSFGTVYKKGVRMLVSESVNEAGSASRTEDISFNVPDIAGFGVSYRPFAASRSEKARNLLFALDVVRVENHDIVEGFTSQLNILTNPSFIKSVQFTADNQTEIHVGAEYYMGIGRSTLAFRGGVYTDPDNSVRAVDAGHDVLTGTRAAILDGGAFPGRSDATHITGGIGYSIADLEFAVAFDTSNIESQSLFSVIYRFKR